MFEDISLNNDGKSMLDCVQIAIARFARKTVMSDTSIDI